MISNLKVTKKLVDLAKTHPRTTLLGSFAFITAVVLMLMGGDGGIGEKEKVNTPKQPAIIEVVPDTKIDDNVNMPYYNGYDILVNYNTPMRVEKNKNGKYIGTVNNVNQAELILIDGDYALIRYNIPQERYNYDLSHDHIRLGYVPKDSIRGLTDHLSESAVSDDEYVHFSNDTPIHHSMDDKEGRLITAKKGDYARIVGIVYNAEWDNDNWYIVAYEDFIGYMHGENGEFLTSDEMMDIINTEYDCLEITGKDVNFRNSPSKGNNVTRKLDKGAVCRILSHENGWYHVMIDGIDGYISDEVTCLSFSHRTLIPNGLKYLHFENSNKKTI